MRFAIDAERVRTALADLRATGQAQLGMIAAFASRVRDIRLSGDPLVMNSSSPAILHKSDIGGVKPA